MSSRHELTAPKLLNLSDIVNFFQLSS